MNIAFTLISILSLVTLLILSPEKAFPTMIDGVSGAIQLTIKLTAVYAVWMSVLKMAEKSGLDKKLSKGLRPIVKRIFKEEKEDAYDHISVNLASNMLGMGGAATPAGIRAMEVMQDGSEYATDNMIMLLIINATSIQLIPATVVALRATSGSANAGDIILPTLISSSVATISGMILSKVFASKKK